MTSLPPQEFTSVARAEAPLDENQGFACHVLIIGGGASGTLMALHLLNASPDMRVTVIEKSALLGCGIAYSTTDPGHLLNTRVHNMSAYPDRPEHFRDWLRQSGMAPGATDESFVGRQIYGRYLNDLIARERDLPEVSRLRCVKDECLRLEETPKAVIAHLGDGTCIRGDRAILATGHAVPVQSHAVLTSGWDFTPPADPGQPVVIIGTGLSMIDHLITLLRNGHRGTITCVSRRGLLPQVHTETKPMAISRGHVPLGAPVSAILHWMRGLAADAERQGGTWRDAVDGIRAHVSAIWRAWPEAERRRFLRHAASFWEVHRHRVPPDSARWLQEARDRGQLRILRGRFEEATMGEDGLIAVRIRTAGGERVLPAGRAVDCRGIRRDPAKDSAPVIQDLLARGQSRLDPLKLGIDTNEWAQVLLADGRPSRRLFAIGPCARGAAWEITAIPDIRVQCAELARHLHAIEAQDPVSVSRG
ncbi:FAD-dependent oxidoreductase [Sinirhodobacter populi]|uniref:FAD-dependent oxidoreductase n=1 Tax=Paenirhodobacter populi TaxID=2306993 RepID=A0A443KBE1_9RHOB|nr:FAD/NAD(P)-binding protein [Sinirhodobacter populi]RWR30080.1 FAD-dependent oxidoreductase [Sinirhodobacter populi]